MKEQLQKIREFAVDDLDKASALQEIEDIKVKFLGKKGELTAILKQMGKLSAEERLLRAIFGEKAREVRDTSLKVPHGEGGIVVDVKIFTKENSYEFYQIIFPYQTYCHTQHRCTAIRPEFLPPYYLQGEG